MHSRICPRDLEYFYSWTSEAIELIQTPNTKYGDRMKYLWMLYEGLRDLGDVPAAAKVLSGIASEVHMEGRIDEALELTRKFQEMMAVSETMEEGMEPAFLPGLKGMNLNTLKKWPDLNSFYPRSQSVAQMLIK